MEVAMQTAFEGAKTDILGGIATVAPYAISIMAAFLVWKYGARFFKAVGK